MTVHDDAESGTELLQWHLDAAKAEIARLRAISWPMTTADEDGRVWRVEQCGRWVYSPTERAIGWKSWGHGDDRQVYVLVPIEDGAT